MNGYSLVQLICQFLVIYETAIGLETSTGKVIQIRVPEIIVVQVAFQENYSCTSALRCGIEHIAINRYCNERSQEFN